MAFSDPIFPHRTGALQAEKQAVMEAWLEGRAYSTWPKIQQWEVWQKQLIWQSRLLHVQFTRIEVVRALFNPYPKRD